MKKKDKKPLLGVFSFFKRKQALSQKSLIDGIYKRKKYSTKGNSSSCHLFTLDTYNLYSKTSYLSSQKSGFLIDKIEIIVVYNT